MSTFDRGPLQTYELTWKNGHTERIQAHQVTYPNNARRLLQGDSDADALIEFYGEIAGHWRLQLRAQLDDIRTIRNLTTTESEVL